MIEIMLSIDTRHVNVIIPSIRLPICQPAGRCGRVFAHGYVLKGLEQLKRSSGKYGTNLKSGCSIRFLCPRPLQLKLKSTILICILITAPINGGYSDWSDWSPCSRSCEGGSRERRRSCTKPLPANGGADCRKLGRNWESRRCNVHKCPGELEEHRKIIIMTYCLFWKRTPPGSDPQRSVETHEFFIIFLTLNGYFCFSSLGGSFIAIVRGHVFLYSFYLCFCLTCPIIP